MAMKLPMGKVGIALIGLSGTGKTTIGRLLARELDMHFHDMDDDGLEGSWGKGGVAQMLLDQGDEGFLEAERALILEAYGREDERKRYVLDGMILATSGSLVLESEAMEYIRERMVTLYLDLADTEVERRATERGITRIVGMNGPSPRFTNMRDVLAYRRPFYERYADLTFRLSPGTLPEEDAENIGKFIEQVKL